jgi:hypothetical protein
MSKFTASGVTAILFVVATITAGLFLIISGKSVELGIGMLAPTSVIVGYYFGANNKPPTNPTSTITTGTA